MGNIDFTVDNCARRCYHEDSLSIFGFAPSRGEKVTETATVAGKAVLRFRRFWRLSIIAATFQELRQRCAFARLTDQPLDDLRPAQPALL